MVENNNQFQYLTGNIPTTTDYIFYKSRDESSESDISLVTFNIPSGSFTHDRSIPVAVSDNIELNEDVPTYINFIGCSKEGPCLRFTLSLLKVR